MRSGVTATYGDGSDLAAKGQALKAVLTYAAQHGGAVASVDVEVPGAPTGGKSRTRSPIVPSADRAPAREAPVSQLALPRRPSLRCHGSTQSG